MKKAIFSQFFRLVESKYLSLIPSDIKKRINTVIIFRKPIMPYISYL